MGLPPLRGDELIGPDRRRRPGERRRGKWWNRLRRLGMRLGWLAVGAAIPTMTGSALLGIYAGITLPGRVAGLQRTHVRDSTERAEIRGQMDTVMTVVLWEAMQRCGELSRTNPVAWRASAQPCGMAAYKTKGVYPP